jgi:hypothetical protein
MCGLHTVHEADVIMECLDRLSLYLHVSCPKSCSEFYWTLEYELETKHFWANIILVRYGLIEM